MYWQLHGIDAPFVNVTLDFSTFDEVLIMTLNRTCNVAIYIYPH